MSLVKNLIVVVGQPNSLFPNQLASYWRAQGRDAVIVSRFWDGPNFLDSGTPVLRSFEAESFLFRKMLVLLSLFLKILEKLLFFFHRERVETIFRKHHYRPFPPNFSNLIVDGISIARFVRSLKPSFVFGQEVFSYGVATALCWGYPRFLMPWGGDVYFFCDLSWPLHALTRFALNRAHGVYPTSTSAAKHIHLKFDVPENRIFSVSWGIDPKVFHPLSFPERERVRKKWGISFSAFVVLNVRQFHPAWGSETALMACLEYSKKNLKARFIFFCGKGNEEEIHQAMFLTKKYGKTDQFIFLERGVSLEDFQELCGISDVFLSLMRIPDMRSFSILQASACGSLPILGDQAEYREMEKLGFRALFVDPEKPASTVQALEWLEKSPEPSRDILGSNVVYLKQHEDRSQQLEILTHHIEETLLSFKPESFWNA